MLDAEDEFLSENSGCRDAPAVSPQGSDIKLGAHPGGKYLGEIKKNWGSNAIKFPLILLDHSRPHRKNTVYTNAMHIVSGNGLTHRLFTKRSKSGSVGKITYLLKVTVRNLHYCKFTVCLLNMHVVGPPVLEWNSGVLLRLVHLRVCRIVCQCWRQYIYVYRYRSIRGGWRKVLIPSSAAAAVDCTAVHRRGAD